MADNQLTPVEQKEVNFYGDELTAVRLDDGHIYASVSQMCQALGIDTQAQTRRIRRHTILEEGLKGVANLATPGGKQSGYVLRADLVPLWLSGVRTKAVSEDVRPKLERFQREAAKVLWEAFREGRLTADPTFDDLLNSTSPAAQAYRMAQAIMTMARQQLIHESRLDTHEQRLEAIEEQLGSPDRFVTADQAMQISQAVKTIAMVLSKASKSNQYGAVYGEMYRKYGITSYKQLPASKFDDAMAWLTEWHSSLVSGSPF